jgi:hypothetical protein
MHKEQMAVIQFSIVLLLTVAEQVALVIYREQDYQVVLAVERLTKQATLQQRKAIRAEQVVMEMLAVRVQQARAIIRAAVVAVRVRRVEMESKMCRLARVARVA